MVQQVQLVLLGQSHPSRQHHQRDQHFLLLQLHQEALEVPVSDRKQGFLPQVQRYPRPLGYLPYHLPHLLLQARVDRLLRDLLSHLSVLLVLDLLVHQFLHQLLGFHFLHLVPLVRVVQVVRDLQELPLLEYRPQLKFRKRILMNKLKSTNI